jgi:hypothetical protein
MAVKISGREDDVMAGAEGEGVNGQYVVENSDDSYERRGVVVEAQSPSSSVVSRSKVRNI